MLSTSCGYICVSDLVEKCPRKYVLFLLLSNQFIASLPLLFPSLLLLPPSSPSPSLSSLPPLTLQLGYEHLLRGEVREALQTYKKAFNLDETSIPALAGIIHCQLLEGQVAEAEQQLEFLAEVSVCVCLIMVP